MPTDNDLDGQRRLACFTRESLEWVRRVERPDILLVHEWPSGVVRPEDDEPAERGHRRLHHRKTGCELIRELVWTTEPQLVLCGHLHRPYAGWLPTRGGGRARVVCLGEFDGSGAGWALFAAGSAGIEELAQ
jgi:hypothetical protein